MTLFIYELVPSLPETKISKRFLVILSKNKETLQRIMKSNYHVFFTHLANPLKMDIVLLLRRKELCVGEICKKLGVEQSKVSHALISLKSCNVVKSEQKGKHRYYVLNDETIVPILNLIDKHSVKHCKKKGCMCRSRAEGARNGK